MVSGRPLFFEFLNKKGFGKIQRTGGIGYFIWVYVQLSTKYVYKDNDNELIRYVSPINDNEPHYIFYRTSCYTNLMDRPEEN